MTQQTDPTSPRATKSINVVFVDDAYDVANMARMRINREPPEIMRCQRVFTDGRAFLDWLDAPTTVAERSEPIVLLLDFTLPGMSVPAMIADLAQTHPEVRVIVFSGHDDSVLRDMVCKAGAWGCISKHRNLDEVIKTIRKVASGECMSQS